MTKRSIWQYLIDALHQHDRAALLIVVASKGSSPGTAGAKMALSADGSSLGTVGGGRVEFELSQLAHEALTQHETSLRLYNRYHNEHQANASGQICGGYQQVVLWLCCKGDLPVLETLQQLESERRPVMLSVTAHGVDTATAVRQLPKPRFDYRDDDNWRYQEMIGLRKQAYIIGGGHVGLALSQLLALLDFEISVFDQRDNVPTMNANDFAGRKAVVPYSDIVGEIGEGPLSYVFVMTHTHETDQQVVESLAGKDFRYLGVMGSRRKINMLKKNLAETIGTEVWERIHAPLGLPINSSTPMEIAVSIVAELIQFDNGA